MIDFGYIDPHCPVDWRHPLNVNRVAWWLALPNPGWMGGKLFRDIVRGGKKPNDGTLTSMAIPGTATSGWGPTARPGGWGEMRFDGTDDAVQLDASVLSSMVGSKIGSIALWFNPRGNLTTYQSLVDTVSGASASRQMSLFLGANSSQLFVGWAGNAGSAVTLSKALSLNVWQRVIVTCDGTTKTVYVDGLSRGSATSGIGSGFSAISLQLGSDSGIAGGGTLYVGYEDDISIWSRALSPGEVWADYQLSRQGYPGVLNRWGMVARDYTDVVIPPGSGFRVIVNAQPLSQLVGGGLARG